MQRHHYYGLTAEGPNASKGIEYVYLGCFQDFEEANEMAEAMGYHMLWISTQDDMLALYESIKNHLTIRGPQDKL